MKTNKSFGTGKRAGYVPRLVCLLALPLLHPFALFAQTPLADCADIEDSKARLACYDAAMAQAKGASRTPSVPQAVVSNPQSSADKHDHAESTAVAAVKRPQSATDNVDDFGLELKQSVGADGPDGSRIVTVTTATHNRFSGWTMEFANGQVWRQIGTDRYRIKVGEQYFIQRAMLNSYFLSNNSDNRKIRVTRLQ